MPLIRSTLAPTPLGSRDPRATFLDATPDLIHVPSAACRIAAAFPRARLVAVLRDPVQRALSNWNMVGGLVDRLWGEWRWMVERYNSNSAGIMFPKATY